MDEEQLARALGWFSLGLGITEILAPDSLARAIGVKDGDGTRTMLRVVGLREIASGIAILTQSRPAGWLWARVAGDAMDMALLGSTLTSGAADRNRAGVAMASVMGIAALDTYSSGQMSRRPTRVTDGGRRRKIMDVKRSITVKRSPAELYAFWHDFQNLPRFMQHLNSVKVNGDKQSHWVAKGPAGSVVEWDAEITQDQPDRLIAWQSLEGATVKNGGVVRFEPAPGDRGTEVHVEMTYEPPLGPLGATVAKIFGEEPKDQVDDDLRHFKQVMETGEVVQSEATARGGGPAQPVATAASR